MFMRCRFYVDSILFHVTSYVRNLFFYQFYRHACFSYMCTRRNVFAIIIYYIYHVSPCEPQRISFMVLVIRLYVQKVDSRCLTLLYGSLDFFLFLIWKQVGRFVRSAAQSLSDDRSRYLLYSLLKYVACRFVLNHI